MSKMNNDPTCILASYYNNVRKLVTTVVVEILMRVGNRRIDKRALGSTGFSFFKV